MDFKHYINDNKKQYIGHCISCLDNQWFNQHIASDATELAQIVDNGKQVSASQFRQTCHITVPKLHNDLEYYVNDNKYSMDI